jgi:predicted nucleotidyltransferase
MSKMGIFTMNEQKIIKDIIDVVITFIHPSRVIMFGSRAGGKAREYSDFDIAVEGVEMDIRKERLLKEALDRKMGIFTVDLINLDKADREFKRLISQKGKVIYEC